jgi:hypothetical protein
MSNNIERMEMEAVGHRMRNNAWAQAEALTRHYSRMFHVARASGDAVVA